MAESIRERNVKTLAETIQGVTFFFNSSQVSIKAVDRHRRTKYQQHELPAVNIWEGKERKIPGPSGLTTCFLPVFLEITVLDLRQMATLANEAMAAVMKAVLQDPQQGGLAVDIEEKGNETFIGEQNDPTGGVRVELEIEYRHKEDDPYAQL